MTNRIYPLLDIKFRVIESETLHYMDNKLQFHDIPLKCLKIIDNRFKVYVDYGFKGNSRYANEKSDYYVIDMNSDNALLLPNHNDYGSIVHSLNQQVETENRNRPALDFVSDIKVITLTMTHLVHDGWLFTQEANGDIVAFQPDWQEKKQFADDDSLKAWLLDKATEY